MRQIYRIPVILALLISIMAPISLVLYQSFLDSPFYLESAALSLSSYEFVFNDPGFYRALRNSLAVAVGMTAISVPLGIALAFLVIRTDMPGRSWLEPLILCPMFISSVILAFGYTIALGPAGVVSIWVESLIGFVPWDIYSPYALITVAGLSHAPHVYLYAASALRSLNSDVEDAARTAGAGPLRVSMTISLPMIMPAIMYSSVLLLFLGFELFGLPLILTSSNGYDVLATYLYKLTALLGTPSYQLMAVVVVVLIAISLPMVAVQRHLLQYANRYISVRGKVSAKKPIRLGFLRWIAVIFVVGWLVISAVVPIAALILRSFVTTWGFGVSFIDVLTLDNFAQLFRVPGLMRATTNTILIASIGGAISVGVFAVINLATHRWRSPWVRVVDYSILLPRAMPGLVAGLAIFWVFLFIEPLRPLRPTLVSIWVAYTLVWLAYGMRLVSTSFLQIAPELEEAARVSGAGAGRVSRDITLPLVRSGLIGAWILIFVTFAKEYSTGVYLLTPGSEVLGSVIVSQWSAGRANIATALSVVNLAIIGFGVILMLAMGRSRNV